MSADNKRNKDKVNSKGKNLHRKTKTKSLSTYPASLSLIKSSYADIPHG